MKSSRKLSHAIVKLVNGEELICQMDDQIITYYGDYQRSNEYVTIHKPMKGMIEQYYEKSDEDGEEFSVYEKTVMTSWVRFSYVECVDLACSNILVVCKPNEAVIDRYEDLILKYDTYKSNPELANELFGNQDSSNMIHEDDIIDNLDNNQEDDNSDDDDTVDLDDEEF